MPMRSVVFVLTSCYASLAFVEPQATPQSATPTPILFQREGVPLSQLLSDARAMGPVVTIQKATPSGADLVAPAAGERQLEWIASLSPIILVVRADHVVPRLTP